MMCFKFEDYRHLKDHYCMNEPNGSASKVLFQNFLWLYRAQFSIYLKPLSSRVKAGSLLLFSHVVHYDRCTQNSPLLGDVAKLISVVSVS